MPRSLLSRKKRKNIKMDLNAVKNPQENHKFGKNRKKNLSSH